MMRQPGNSRLFASARSIAVYGCRRRVERLDRFFEGSAGRGRLRAIRHVALARLLPMMRAWRRHFLLHSRPARKLAARTIGEWRNGNGRPLAAARWHRRRSEEHTSELQSLMRSSYAVLCLTKKTKPIAK